MNLEVLLVDKSGCFFLFVTPVVVHVIYVVFVSFSNNKLNNENVTR